MTKTLEPLPEESQESWSEYKKKLLDRKKEVQKNNKDLRLDSCNGFSKPSNMYLEYDT